jgi:hypothetical protein
LFGTLAAAEGRTNKSGLVLTLGLGGHGVLISNEKLFEAFYSYPFASFAMLTANLQVIRLMLQGSKTAVLSGVRLVVDF